MTRSLTAAIAKLETLAPDEQERVATWLLDELGDEARWARQFAKSQDLLADRRMKAWPITWPVVLFHSCFRLHGYSCGASSRRHFEKSRAPWRNARIITRSSCTR